MTGKSSTPSRRDEKGSGNHHCQKGPRAHYCKEEKHNYLNERHWESAISVFSFT